MNTGHGVLGKYGQINRLVQPADNAKHFSTACLIASQDFGSAIGRKCSSMRAIKKGPHRGGVFLGRSIA